MQNITTIIVDDEPLARRRIHDLLAKEPDIEILAESPDGLSAVEVIFEKQPDLVFLDIQMPEMDGFEVVQQIKRAHMPAIIFVTAYDQFAIQAFEVHALDYLLKPYDDDRFGEALDRVRKIIRRQQNSGVQQRIFDLLETHPNLTGGKQEAPPESIFIDRFAVKQRGETILVQADEVDHITGEGVYVRLHAGNKSHLLRERMSELEKRLNPRRFFRIHRSTIVNLECIKKLVPHFRGDYIVVLHNDVRLKLSRGRRESLQKRLGASF